MAKKNTGESPSSIIDMMSDVLNQPDLETIAVDLTEDDIIEDNDGVTGVSTQPAEAEVDTKKPADEEDLPDSDIPEPADEDNNDLNFSDEDEDNDDIDEAETSQVSLFFDAFSEELGWEVDEEKKPTTITGLIDYMRELVEEESQPEYSNDQVKELDEFIKNGGKFEDYFKVVNQATDFENLDLTDESNQKTVVRELLKKQGYSDKQINSKIGRLEEVGLLEDEANDAAELLKEDKAKERAELVKQQEEFKKEQIRQQEAFHEELKNSINDLKEVRGIKIPIEDRKKLMEYALKPEADGKTRYQKEYGKNVIKNFIESAYFTMKGDALLGTAKRSGETNAVKKLKQHMKSNKIGKSKEQMDNSSATPVWSVASSLLRRD